VLSKLDETLRHQTPPTFAHVFAAASSIVSVQRQTQREQPLYVPAFTGTLF